MLILDALFAAIIGLLTIPGIFDLFAGSFDLFGGGM